MIANAVPATRRRVWPVMLGVFLVVVAVFVANIVINPLLPADRVFLKAGPFNDEVQMFERVGTGPEGIVHLFPSRTVCTVVADLAYYDVAGSQLQFYKLKCDGKTGYVNAKWVSPY